MTDRDVYEHHGQALNPDNPRWWGPQGEAADAPQDALDENTLAANLAELVDGSIDAEDFERVWDPDCAESFEEAGVLTGDDGFRFRIGDGRMADVTVKIQSR